ncbi:MAG: SH3 domain-containing protein [Clostridia bacterium]|nr:SH3 domain-containing protein [Clostridia bacterium]
MKKRILALLLAGLLTASLAACVSSNKRPDDDTTDSGTGTEPDQTREEGTTTGEDSVILWEDAEGTLYVTVNNLTLTPVDSENSSLKVSMMDELTRVKISADDKRSIVEKDGVQYYVSNASVSDQDLLGKNFTALEAEKTMHVISPVQIRTYASTDNSFSTPIRLLAVGDTVQAVATGEACDMTWYKIKVVDPETEAISYYFVSANTKYLSEDPNGSTEVDYSEHFTACETPFVMYVRDKMNLNLRSTPDADADNIIRSLTATTEVKILAMGKESYENWYQVKVADPKVAGMPQTYSIGYVNASYLDPTNGSFEQLVAHYGFTAFNATMYATTDGLGVRTTPHIPGENATTNRIDDLMKKEQVQVVAIGDVENIPWCMIEREEGTGDNKKTVYLFVSANYLTTDPNGEPMVSLEELLTRYPEFAKEETESKVYATEKTYGFSSLTNTPPTVDNAKLTIESATELTLVAKGTKYDLSMYIVQDSKGAYYFVFAEFFSNSAAVG